MFPAIKLAPGYERLGGYEDCDPISYFQNELDDLTKAVMMGAMLQDTGELISDNPAVGIGFYGNALFTARMLGM